VSGASAGATARLSPAAVWLGMLAFGVLDAPLLLGVAKLAPSWSPAARAALLAAVVAVLAMFGLAARRRDLAAGLLAGYGVMTVVSGGACTLFVPAPAQAPIGALLYVVALTGFGAGLLIRRRRPKEPEGWDRTT